MQLANVTYAEIARTVADGRHLGIAQVAWAPRPFRVRHANDAEGNPILLCRTSGGLARALRRRGGHSALGRGVTERSEEAPHAAPGHDEVAIVLNIDSSVGRVWVSGWAHPIHGDGVRAAALEFAAVNPVSDLLALGEGFELHHLDVAEVRLETGECCLADLGRGSSGHAACRRELIEIDVAAYAAASPVDMLADGPGNSPVM